jgi:non-specific serine/threonine protein kinase/serine/threonine-protein kinase
MSSAFTPADWETIERTFMDVLDLPPPAREAVLAARCAGRPDVRDELVALLSAHERSGGFLDVGPPLPVGAASQAELEEGRLLGAFRVGREIGRGGMGVVHAGERADGAFAQSVAIKVLAAPLADADAVQRFRTEQQILADLQHPHVVSLIDAGMTADGRAYLVMERVDGLPITAYCREHRLSLEDRLRLFLGVCSAVRHAHRHLVVHRDLKPANIVVTADGLVKVLDFGVAKLLEPEVAGHQAATGPLRAPLTPNYASPEQVKGLPVTTSSDVYALGVLLYELVTGVRPYETDGLTLDRLLAVVVDQSPPRPSAATRPAGDTDPPYGLRRLRGDVDAIVLKAISKDADQRYASAEELARDIERFLDGVPIVARSPSTWYVLRKAAARHRSTVVVAAVLAVALVAALAMALWQARVATSQHARAERRFNDLRRLAHALIFDVHDAVAPLDGSLAARRLIVSEALRYLDGLAREVGDDEELQAELGRAYARIARLQGDPGTFNLGDREGAMVNYRRALSVLERVAGRSDAPVDLRVDSIDTRLALSWALNRAGKPADARTAAEQALREAERLVTEHPDHPGARASLAHAHMRLSQIAGVESVEPHARRALALFEELLAAAPDDPARQRQVALAAKYLGSRLDTAGKDAEALPHYERARDLDVQQLSRNPTDRRAQLDLAIDYANIGAIHSSLGQQEQAIRLYEQSRELRQRAVDADPKNEFARSRLAYVHVALARVHAHLGHREQTRADATRALDLVETLPAADFVRSLYAAEASLLLGDAERALGRDAAACRAYARAAESYASVERAGQVDDQGQRANVDKARERAAACRS